ncbi:hypothetical protein [Kitasatospora terrestris]|uniref:Uncharacterized protein n=1 Tax=Kitasatospora terrestris TaxID=258051 RepID=A0ABP9E8Z3_9ACTN
MSDGWGTDSTPDWTALAEQHEREQSRRKRLRRAGAVAAAVLAVGGVTATAVALGNRAGGGTDGADRLALDATGAPTAPTATAPSPEDGPATPSATGSPSASVSGSASAAPSATKAGKPSASATTTGPAAPPTPPDPLTVISSATTDTAPLSPAALFPAATLSVDGKTWTRLVDGSTSTCWQATTGGLGDVLAAQGCRSLLRVSYVSGTSVVTVGVAVMDTRAQADAAQAAHKGQVQGLVKAGSTAYCTSAGCTNTHAAIGRYGYYTVSGTTKGGTAADPVATAAGPDFAAYVQGQLLARGRR